MYNILRYVCKSLGNILFPIAVDIIIASDEYMGEKVVATYRGNSKIGRCRYKVGNRTR